MTSHETAAPDTIVLIHGRWMTPLSWEKWSKRFTDKGYEVIARSWPGMDGDIEELRRDPSQITGLGLTEIVDHYDGIVRELDRPPIIMGHSFGGLITQILLDRGLGAAGIAVASAPASGVLFQPLASLRGPSTALDNPAQRPQAESLTLQQFRYAFGNTLSEDASSKAYERYTVPGPDRLLFQAEFENFKRRAATMVDFHNDNRAPLLLIAGGQDRIYPPSSVKANYELYRESSAVTAYKEFPDQSHYILGQRGWEEVADYALTWALEKASVGPVMEP